MALLGKLIIEGHSSGEDGFAISECHYNFFVKISNVGRLTTRVRAGVIDIYFEGEDDHDLINWMLKTEKLNGKIVFSVSKLEGSLGTLEFRDAFIAEYDSRFVATETTKIKIKIANTSHENSWFKDDDL